MFVLCLLEDFKLWIKWLLPYDCGFFLRALFSCGVLAVFISLKNSFWTSICGTTFFCSCLIKPFLQYGQWTTPTTWADSCSTFLLWWWKSVKPLVQTARPPLLPWGTCLSFVLPTRWSMLTLERSTSVCLLVRFTGGRWRPKEKLKHQHQNPSRGVVLDVLTVERRGTSTASVLKSPVLESLLISVFSMLPERTKFQPWRSRRFPWREHKRLKP